MLLSRPLPVLAQGAAGSATLQVVDGDTRLPVRDVIVRTGSRVLARTDSLGRALVRVAGDGSELTLQRLGYAPWRGRIVPADSVRSIRLTPVRYELSALEVRSRALGRGGALQASSVVSAEQLAERLAPSIAAAIVGEPGVSARTNGPMATQPVIRGLTGDRVLVLEDGMRTGDIATTAPDHAVTIEPATAEQIEVIRGPGGLLYGSNTLGGVVNVIRDDIPRVRPSRMTLAMSTFGESVNGGIGVSGRARGAVGALSWAVDGTGRQAGDTRGPNAVALPFGHAGVSAREYRSYYGVPSSFGGTTLPGAHDGGVYVDARRTQLRWDAEWRTDDARIEAISVGGNAVRFEQSEFEQGGFVGTRFGQLAASGEAVLRLRAGAHRGAIGSFVQWRDLRAEGSFTGTRPAVQRTVALFAVDEYSRGPLTLLAGARVDRSDTRPLDSTETLLLRDVRTRAFTAVTGAFGARVQLPAGFEFSTQVARAFRPPSIEELYSAGPHLASYAYEIGDPSLEAERGTGVDALLSWRGGRGRAELSAYGMRVDDYVAFAPQLDPTTGAPMRDPRLRRYVVYRPQQVDAVLWGVEGRAVFAPTPRWTFDLSGALPRGAQRGGATSQPLPAMPAATLRLDVRRQWGSLTLGMIGDRRFAQRLVPDAPVLDGLTCTVQVVDGEAQGLPAEFCATPGALLVNALVAWRLPARATRWPATLTPQPGRNVRLVVQVER
ncbi:MAG: TonB-dependent receptor [Gemmatimonadaceae bacterium]|nr:TonB-dependent receptor [Gemmatimonadaceae bacterium]